MTTGEGGMITVNSKDKYEKCSSIRSRGMDINRKEELFINLGSNYRVTEFQALLGTYQLKRLDEFILHRNKIANIYKDQFENLIDRNILRLQNPAKNSRHAYWRFIVFLEHHNRDIIKKKLRSYNIKSDAPYDPLLHKQPIFKRFKKRKYTNAEKLSSTHISLPMNKLISENDAKFIAKTLVKLLV